MEEKQLALNTCNDKKNKLEMNNSLGSVTITSLLRTALLRRLQVQTLPDATPPEGKIHPFSKIAVTF